ncbi:PAS domain S-box-containing protein [Paenibacillus sophorae]|uniref:histidine kinase n=1 Tax=Paenibacillus sophorae TaxID=1333845 RepID=A0A1H8VZ21_9BACL|nr:ATP-binding protein [Paenibacillus sophorae]QWU16377.1 PAS domain S-box protein [Paenibacillus sophorae]SEP20605.1 PAS domain S-box-containing protein [Paenibacillus sophorae]
MSIKTKLSAIIFGSVLLILALNLTLNSYATRNNMRSEIERNMKTAAMQIAVSVEQSNYSSNYAEQLLAQNLRMAAILISQELDPDIVNVSNAELKTLASKVGVSNISLLIRAKDNIVVKRSSDPKELGLPTKGWGYWYTAFVDLFERREVSVAKGQRMEHFWSGPFEYSSSNPEFIEKWGYYYDGRSNYIIDPYIRSTSISDYVRIMSPEEIVKQTMEVNPDILEITGINPSTFGSSTMAPDGTDNVNVKLRNRPIMYGTYRFGNLEQDINAVQEALAKQEPVMMDTMVRGARVLKSFIPVTLPDSGTYVISVVIDYSVISSVIKLQLWNNIRSSLLLLAVFLVGSYILAGFIIRPIQAILTKVQDVSRGKFEPPLEVGSRDELGQLTLRINAMTRNLALHTSRLRQTVEENRKVKEHLESVINGTSDAIHTADMSGTVISVNRAFEELYGWKEREVVGSTIRLVPDSVLKEEETRLQWLIKGAQLAPTETLRLKRDGTVVEVSVSTSVIRDEEGKPVSFVHVSRDMTERNRMEELLRQSEKLTTVGQLAAGVAHEIRNPLTTLRGFLQLQREKNMLVPLHVDLMLSELERINLIVSEFLILAKPQAVRFQQKDVRHVLHDVISLLDSQAHLHNIEVKDRFEVSPAMVHCEENQLKQVFINIIKNGIESMSSGGTITLEQKRIGDSIVIVISDEGEGIPENILPKLGQPFFSNKETGTGLGLMISQRIIQAHKGMMEIESQVGRGTSVTIVLPAAKESAEPINEETGGGKETE